MDKFLLDTNIIISLLNNDIRYIKFLKETEGEYCISGITYIEVLLGEVSSEIINTLDRYIFIPINKKIANKSIPAMYKKRTKGFRNNNVADYIIGATAKIHNIPLVTNNPKDFQMFKELEIVVP
jgi:predicted nucleic acid-binding protein